ncbi:transcriptional repressor TCF25-domain-containing protein [Gamsiella multidivaricata]|uniref:transcriptional repressor TCF25-domain-containing protein n=1 Tax=Gamsiella multidivaricata TaxID=101098 RepID=UPI00221EE988|nr:transcriptional repressor TCF25-domain-containing protein [Gamsiella multidivaricata]KAG0356542.1 Transcription factor 25 [Gamsiella multidivaricata]KAI7819259.1 transcriptional repressor TCF25-domain-containing protein [Gamsiella multidivaricata]
MSSRAMKKLLRDSNGPTPLKDRDQHNATTELRPENKENEEQDANENGSEEEDDYIAERPSARNLFALLDEDDQEDDSEPDEEDKEPTNIIPVATSNKKKKNKKKKSGASAAVANPFDALKDDKNDTTTADTVDSTPISEQADDSTATAKTKKNKRKQKGKAVAKSLEEMSVEEFERSLQQMNQKLGDMSSAGGSSQKSTVTPLKQLLAVDTRFLDADAEMKKMFGARVVNSEIKDRRYAKVTKKALLAQPRNTWPVRKASGLSMEIVEMDEKENVTTFKIVHSEYYQRTQLKFLAAVASYDPGNLVALLRESPFHIDSLLQLSEVSKHNGDNSLAGEFIEQALYAFEKSFHSLFNIASGAVRLNFMEVENRSFFLAIHRHIQFLGRRGCWRTAFEFNRLLLSLDPKNDPLGALLSIDFYALKAQEYVYLTKLYERMEVDHGLNRMPNFLYSIAMAYFHLETAQGDNKHEQSSRMLQRAILMFPTAVPLLAEQGNFSVDNEIAGEAAFYPAADLPKVLDLYVHLFVLRNFALWKEPEVIAWLKSNVQVCVQSRFKNQSDSDVKDAKALLTEFTSAAASKSPVLSYGPDGTLESDDYSSSSMESNKVSLRVCRHVLVSEYNSLARFLPQEIVTATMHMHDPLPPPGSRNVYEERFEAQRGAGGLFGEARDAAQSVLEEVVRRLRAGGLGGLGGGGGAGGAGGAEAGELQEAQLRQIAEAVQMLRQGHAPPGALPGALPGAFPGQRAPAPAGDRPEGIAAMAAAGGPDGAEGQHGAALGAEVEESLAVETAGNASMFQSLSDMMRLLGFGARGGAGAEGADAADGGDGRALTQEEQDELMAAVVNNFPYPDGAEEGEGEEEDYTDEEDQPFGSDGDDGWEPYDPAAYE